jgi:hypothetical protein
MMQIQCDLITQPGDKEDEDSAFNYRVHSRFDISNHQRNTPTNQYQTKQYRLKTAYDRVASQE